MNIYIYILVMAGVTYLIRALPFVLVKGKITSRFIRSFLYYVPYAVLTAMTIPAIFYSTGNTVTAAIGLAVALILSYMELPLIAVAVAAAGVVFVSGIIL